MGTLRILCMLEFPSVTKRFWDGSGPYLDPDGNIWEQSIVDDSALDVIESAINGEAYTMPLTLSSIPTDIANLAWQDTEEGDVIDSKVTILIQRTTGRDEPDGDPKVHFTGYIDDIDFTDFAHETGSVSNVTIYIRNRFTLRTMTSGVTLSDVDRKAISAVLNPGADPDRIAERMSELVDKSIVWPAWN